MRDPVPSPPPAKPVALLYGPLALAALLAAYAWRHGAWYGPAGRLTTNFLGLRYLSPLLPTLALCAAATQAPATWRPLRAGALFLALILGTGGLALRTREWRTDPESWAGRSVCERDAPAGPPGWPEAPAALVTHLAQKDGEPLLCRRDHMIELAGSSCAHAAVPPLAAEVLAAARSPVEVQAFLDPCMQQAWGSRWREPGGCSLATWRALLEATCSKIGEDCGAWRPDVAASLLRSAPWGCITGLDAGAVGADPALHPALCRMLGENAVFWVHEAQGDQAGLTAPATCSGEAAWAWGAGWAWSRWFGCADDATTAWERTGGAALGPSAAEGRAAACAVYAPTALRP